MAALVVDCPRKGQSVALGGLGEYLRENALDEEKDAQKDERLRDGSFDGPEQGSHGGEVSLEQGSLQSLGKSCGLVG